MTETSAELAYYYPEPFWGPQEVDSIKTLLLFFDGISILLPKYMSGRNVQADPILAGPLQDAGLLRVLEPETFVDQAVTEHLAEAMVELITAGAFDDLPRPAYYAELSQSRMGWDADVGLAQMLVDELKARDLARPSEDGVSVPLHPVVRKTILVLLSQLAREAGRRSGLELHPTTSRQEAMDDLIDFLSLAPMPSAGHVVALDLEVVSLNLAPVSLDEVLGFRKEHGAEYRAYARGLRQLIAELAPLETKEREQRLLDRRDELTEAAHSLSSTSRRAWRRPLASFAIGAAGAGWAAGALHDPVTAALSAASGILGGLSGSAPVGAYSYLVSARTKLGSRSAGRA